MMKTNRAAYTRPNPNLHCGKAKLPVITGAAIRNKDDLQEAREALRLAISAPDHKTFLVRLSDAHRVTHRLLKQYLRP